MTPSLPFVSVVLPIRNEEVFITKGLEALFNQDYPPDQYEIIVADGLSTDQTRPKIKALQARHCNLRLIDNPGRIVSTGLNRAIAVARGQIIVRVDGHTLISPDYIRQCVMELQRTSASNVGGKMTAQGQGAWGAATALATSSPFGVGGARFHYSTQEEWVDTVYMGAWPREVFERVGLFDEELVRNQDDEFNYRLRASGGKILLSPRINSTYSVRSTIRGLCRQYLQYGFWKVRVLQKHPRQMQARQFVPPVFVLVLLLVFALAVFSPAAQIGLLALGGTYLAATLVAAVYTARGANWKFMAGLPFIFAVLHLSYGSGFLVGLLFFWNRWGDRSGQVPLVPAVDASRR